MGNENHHSFYFSLCRTPYTVSCLSHRRCQTERHNSEEDDKHKTLLGPPIPVCRDSCVWYFQPLSMTKSLISIQTRLQWSRFFGRAEGRWLYKNGRRLEGRLERKTGVHLDRRDGHWRVLKRNDLTVYQLPSWVRSEYKYLDDTDRVMTLYLLWVVKIKKLTFLFT